MGSCKIQRPTGLNSNSGEHGKLYAQISCNNDVGEEHKFDAIKGDLRLNLICEEEDGFAFYIGDDSKKAIAKLEEKIDDLERIINNKNDCECEFDITEFENYMYNNPIDTTGLDPNYTQDSNNIDLTNFFYYMNNNPI